MYDTSLQHCGSLVQCQSSGKPGSWFPCSKRASRECAPNTEASHYLTSLGKFKVLERKVQPLVEPLIEGE